MRDIADDIETGLDLAALVVWGVTERVAADNRLRREILAHNAGVAAARAQRARNRAVQVQVGRDLQARFLASRAN